MDESTLIRSSAFPRRASKRSVLRLCLALFATGHVVASTCAAAADEATPPAAPKQSPAQATAAVTPSGAAKPAHAKPHRPAKKKAEPEEDEWILLPEPVKQDSAAEANHSGEAAATEVAPSAGNAAAPDASSTAQANHAAATVNPSETSNAALAAPARTDTATPPVAPATTAASSAAPTDAPSAVNAAAPAAAATAAPAAEPAREQRIALVIGNSAYKVGRLPNTINDAQGMAAALTQLGWTVIEKENVSLEEIHNAANEFAARLSPGGAALFYYAGHAIQSGSSNFLIPVDGDIQDEDELAARAFDANDVLRKMDETKDAVKIVILDACRNNPFAKSFGTAARGLAPVQMGAGAIIAYATQPGATAADGTAGNGLYTSELLRALAQPGLSVEAVFKQVRVEVKSKSGGKQIPWDSSSLTQDFYFKPTAEQAALPRLANADSPNATSGQPRSFGPVLVSRSLFENYQLTANLPLGASVAAAAFSADGSAFLAVTKDRKLRAWNVGTAAITLSSPTFGAPTDAAEGRYLLGLPDARTLHLLDTADKNLTTRTYTVNADIVTAAVSPEGRRLLVYTVDKGFFLFDTENAALVGDARKIDGDPRFAFSPSGHRVLLWGTKSDDTYLWDTESGKRVGRASPHHKPVTLVRFSKDGRSMLTAAAGDPVYVWQLADGSAQHKLALAPGDPLPAQAAFIRDGQAVIANVPKAAKNAEGAYFLGIWDTATGKPIATLLDNLLVKSMRFSPDEQRLFVTATDETTRIFDLASKTEVDALNGAQLIGFSPDGRRLIAHDGDGVRLYDAHSLTPIARMPGQLNAFIGPVSANLYATAARDGGVQLLEFEKGNIVSSLKGHVDPVVDVKFSPDGKQVVTMSDDKVAKLWALPSIQDFGKLLKDSFESTSQYQQRVANWSSEFSTMVALGPYDADSESFSVAVGDYSVKVPMARDEARQLAGQHDAILSGRLKFYSEDKLQITEPMITRIP